MIDLVQLLEKIKPFVMAWIEGGSGVSLGGITLYHPGTNGVYFPPTDDGLMAVTAVWVSGDAVTLPAGVFTIDLTIPADVTVFGLGRATVLSGTVVINGFLLNLATTGLVSGSGGWAMMWVESANRYENHPRISVYQGARIGTISIGDASEGSSVEEPRNQIFDDSGMNQLIVSSKAASQNYGAGVWWDGDTIYFKIGTDTFAWLDADGLHTDYPIDNRVAGGTPPFSIQSTDLVSNLNADLLDGYHASDFQALLPTHGTGTITRTDGLISAVVTPAGLNYYVLRDANDRISEIGNENNTWTFARDAEELIESWEVS